MSTSQRQGDTCETYSAVYKVVPKMIFSLPWKQNILPVKIKEVNNRNKKISSRSADIDEKSFFRNSTSP